MNGDDLCPEVCWKVVEMFGLWLMSDVSCDLALKLDLEYPGIRLSEEA